MNALIASLLGLAPGVIVGLVVWRRLAPVLSAAEVLCRRNYRGAELAVGSGLVIMIAAALLGGAYALVGAVWRGASPDPSLDGAVQTTAIAVFAYGLLGFVDDVVGSAEVRGFRGHLGALLHGDLTTGAVKLVGGAAVGLLIAAALGADDPVDVLRQGLSIAGAANLANLFDRAPGRTLKVSIAGLAGAVLAAAVVGPVAATVVTFGSGGPTLAGAAALAAPAAVIGAGLAVLRADLGERAMLGDTGANALGAAVGIAWVLAVGTVGEWIVLGVVVGLNAASERIGFSQVIDRVAPLRRLDRWGALPERRAHPATPPHPR